MLVLVVALTAGAATPSEFYLSMLRKGVAAYDGGRFDQAETPLRVAAFGLVDSLEHYQLAHVYLSLTHDRLGNADQARESARRVVTAQRAGGRYGSLQLAEATRANFESVARRALTAADMTILSQAPRPSTNTATANTTPPATQPAQTTTRPATTPATTQTAQNTTTPAQNGSEAARTTNDDTTPPPATPATTTAPTPAATSTQPPPQQQPAPASTTPARTPAQTETVVINRPEATPPPAPAPVQTKPATPAPVNVPARFAAADTALRESRLVDARAIYRELLDQPSLQRAELLRLAEGFYRARDFAHALRAFERLGPLRREEQPYRYYVAVALYETGHYSKAREELAAVLPYIQETADVARYRAKIQNGVN